MTPVDYWTAAAAALGATSIALRAFMLRPKQGAWAAAPASVCVSLSLLAIGLGMAAVSILFGPDHATGREAVICTLIAGAGLCLLRNLDRNGRAEHLRREAIASEVRAVLDASGPAAAYPWEKRRG